MSTLRGLLIGIVLTATWMVGAANNWFDYVDRHARYEHELNECSKLATKMRKMAVQPECSRSAG
jgi:hypothetical protein